MTAKKSSQFIRILAAALLTASSIWPADPGPLKASIEARAPRVRILFEEGLVLEGTDGMLRPGNTPMSKEQRQWMDAENQDRKSVIAMAAKASGLTETEVARRFGERAARNAPSASNQPIGSCRIVPAKKGGTADLVARYKQGVALVAQGKYEAALTALNETKALEKGFVGLRQNIAAANIRLRRFKEAESALKEEIELLNCLRDVSDRDLKRIAYMFELDKPESDRPAAQVAHIKTVMTKARSSIFYNLACLFALQNVRSLAVTYLTQSIQNGFADSEVLGRDPDLANIRGSQEFQELLWAVRAKAKKS